MTNRKYVKMKTVFGTLISCICQMLETRSFFNLQSRHKTECLSIHFILFHFSFFSFQCNKEICAHTGIWSRKGIIETAYVVPIKYVALD